jgi:hypothetical protein
MPSQNVFSWKDGYGWIVLSGGSEPTGAVRAAAIERSSADGALVVLVLDDAAASDAILNDMQELGAPSGYLVNLMTEDDNTIRQQVGDAGIVVLSSDAPARAVHSNLIGAVVDGLATAYDRGALILAEGSAAVALGAFIVDDGTVLDGLGWLDNVLVVPGMESASDSPDAQTVMNQKPTAIVIGVAVGTAFVLGGNGMIETWGDKQITIALGSAYTGGE